MEPPPTASNDTDATVICPRATHGSSGKDTKKSPNIGSRQGKALLYIHMCMQCEGHQTQQDTRRALGPKTPLCDNLAAQ